MWYKPCWGLKAPRMSASCIKILVCDRECRRPYHIFQLIIAAFIIIITGGGSSAPVKTGRPEKILNEAINHKEIAYIIPRPAQSSVSGPG